MNVASVARLAASASEGRETLTSFGFCGFAVAAFVVAILVIAFFMNYISRHSFLPFVIYRILLGGAIFALLATGAIDA